MSSNKELSSSGQGEIGVQPYRRKGSKNVECCQSDRPSKNVLTQCLWRRNRQGERGRQEKGLREEIGPAKFGKLWGRNPTPLAKKGNDWSVSGKGSKGGDRFKKGSMRRNDSEASPLRDENRKKLHKRPQM